jgi:hypothetical protein
MCGLATGAAVTLYATALPATMAVVSGIATPAAEAIADEAIAHKNKTKEKNSTHRERPRKPKYSQQTKQKKKPLPSPPRPPLPNPLPPHPLSSTTPKNPQKSREKKEKIKREKVHATQKVVPYFGRNFLEKKKPKKTKKANFCVVGNSPLRLIFFFIFVFFFFWGGGVGSVQVLLQQPTYFSGTPFFIR